MYFHKYCSYHFKANMVLFCIFGKNWKSTKIYLFIYIHISFRLSITFALKWYMNVHKPEQLLTTESQISTDLNDITVVLASRQRCDSRRIYLTARAVQTKRGIGRPLEPRLHPQAAHLWNNWKVNNFLIKLLWTLN